MSVLSRAQVGRTGSEVAFPSMLSCAGLFCSSWRVTADFPRKRRVSDLVGRKKQSQIKGTFT